MRNAFAQEITTLAHANPRLVLLSGDIGNRLFDTFKAAHPDRFYNCGIAEANMISTAAGLASCGLLPVCYTITQFITARCYEQIKIDVAYHQMPVVIVGTGSGLSYASLGATHHSLDDIALLRGLPGMRVLAPADAMELRSCLRASLDGASPTYLRIGKKGEPLVHAAPPAFQFGRWQKLRTGSDLALLSTGTQLPATLALADTLSAQEQVSVSVFSCPSIKPLDEAALAAAFNQHALVVTLEEHSRIGGFGSAVSEWLCSQPARPAASFLSCGALDQFLHSHGEEEHAREHYAISPAQLLSQIKTRLASLTSTTSSS